MAAKQQDRLQRARERYADFTDAMHEQHERIREDLRFSNPANPQQWSEDAKALRVNRPMLTFNHCQKFIRQVTNDGRGNVPSFQVTAADSFAHAKAAEVINGRLRHIEYASRAKIAYTTALGLSANCGLGWLRAVPEILNPETNQQEPRIVRVHDPLSCGLDVDATEPDGSDSEWGFVLSPFGKEKFKRQYPKASDSHGWSDASNLWTFGDTILVAEYFEIERERSNRIVVRMPDKNGEMSDTVSLTEEDYWDLVDAIGFQPEFMHSFMAEEKKVIWSKMTGCEVLEETLFPASSIPLVPVIGDEIWVDGKRYLCGLTRQLMDGQRMHNAEMTSMTESILRQPKAPFAVSMRAIDGHESAWKGLNTGNPAFLPYNDIDKDGNPVTSPQRLDPPAMPSAYANGATMAMTEMEGAVGMYKASFGQQSNAISGRAKLADRRESDTGTYHYHDNLARSVEQLGRIVIEMDRRLTDTARDVRTMAEDGKVGMARYDPEMRQAVKMRGQEVEAINPLIGEYDMRVKVGPTFLTQNEETAAELSEMFRGAPQLLPILGPTWVRMKGIPGGDKLAKLLLSVAPPEVQKIEAEADEEAPIPPQAKLQIQQLEGQIKELSQALEKAAEEADKTIVEKTKVRAEQEKSEGEMRTRGYEAVTDRIKALIPGLSAEQVFAIAQVTVGQALTIPAIEHDDMGDARGMPGPIEDGQSFDEMPEAEPMPHMNGSAMGAGSVAQQFPSYKPEPIETGELQ